MKILVVEDNLQLLEAIRETLIVEQYVCETAKDYTTASEKVHMFTYDVMVVDINLLEESGLKLIREIKNIDPTTVYSGETDPPRTGESDPPVRSGWICVFKG